MSESKKALLAIFIILAAWPAAGFLSYQLYWILEPYRQLPIQPFQMLPSIVIGIGAVALIRLYKLPFAFLRISSQQTQSYFDCLKALLIICLGFLGCGILVGAVREGLLAFFGTAEGGFTPLAFAQKAVDSQRSPAMNLLLSLVLAPITEELLFRAVLAQQLRRILHINLAILVSSLVFAALHAKAWGLETMVQFVQLDFLPLAVLGFFLAIFFFRYGWAAAVLVHALFNARREVVNALPDSPALFLSLAVIGIGLMLWLLISQLRTPASLEYS